MATPETAVELLRQARDLLLGEDTDFYQPLLDAWEEHVDAYLRAHDAASVQGSEGRGWKDKYADVIEQMARLVPVVANGDQLTNEQLIDRTLSALASQAPATDALREVVREALNNCSIDNHGGADDYACPFCNKARAALGQQQEAGDA